ncbi:MAG: Flp pilus assembly protein CpaB [Candidatus Omnitrophota bacterium]
MALMENKNQLLVLLLAVGIGLVAAYLVSVYVTNSINEQTTKIARKFEKEQKQREEAYKQELGALNQKIAQVEQNIQQQVRAAAAKSSSADGSVQERKAVSLALQMPPGKRALTVLIDSLGAVGGLLNPGDFVDIIAQLNFPDTMRPLGNKKEKKEALTAMIFQNLQILAINTNINQPGAYDQQQKDRSLKITFAVTPEEASLLSFAEKNGKLELALRSPNEKKPTMISAATWTTLAEYVLQNTGADLNIPNNHASGDTEAPPPQAAIQIFKSGRGVN